MVAPLYDSPQTCGVFVTFAVCHRQLERDSSYFSRRVQGDLGGHGGSINATYLRVALVLAVHRRRAYGPRAKGAPKLLKVGARYRAGIGSFQG